MVTNTGSLDTEEGLAGARVVLLEQLAEDQPWSKAQLSDLQFSNSLQSNGTSEFHTRIYLIESGEDTSWGLLRISLPDLPERFFKCHQEDRIRSNPRALDMTFAKWARPVKQTLSCWSIQNKMARGVYWDGDSATDPEDIRSSHVRYDSWPPGCRRYEPTRLAVDKPEVRHSMLECVSLYSRRVANKTIGTLFSFPSPMIATLKPFMQETVAENSFTTQVGI